MKFTPTPLPGVMLIEPSVFGDKRGFFLETYRSSEFEESLLPLRFVQENHSRSAQGVLRGLHYQLIQPQGKLVRVARGKVFDVAVDVRRGSPTFGRWFGTELNDIDMKMLYIPPGFAHGFLVLSDIADFIYKCTDYYHPESERGIAWDDPEIGIQWPTTSALIVSERDKRNLPLSDTGNEYLPVYLT